MSQMNFRETVTKASRYSSVYREAGRCMIIFISILMGLSTVQASEGNSNFSDRVQTAVKRARHRAAVVSENSIDGKKPVQELMELQLSHGAPLLAAHDRTPAFRIQPVDPIKPPRIALPAEPMTFIPEKSLGGEASPSK